MTRILAGWQGLRTDGKDRRRADALPGILTIIDYANGVAILGDTTNPKAGFLVLGS